MRCSRLVVVLFCSWVAVRAEAEPLARPNAEPRAEPLAESLAAPPAEAPLVEAPGDGGKLPASLIEGRLSILDGDGKPLFSLKGKDARSAKLYDSQGKEIGKLTLTADKIKAKSADDQALFELKRKDDKIMIKDAKDKELFKLKLKGDRLDFYGPMDQKLYRIDKKADEWLLQDSAGRLQAQGRTQKDGVAVLDKKGKLLHACPELKGPMGLLFFDVRELTPLQQSACLLFFLRK